MPRAELGFDGSRFGYIQVPPLILTGIWYPPAWPGAACGASITRTSVPTSITGYQSIKWSGSPQRQQAGTRNWRGETGGTGTDAVLRLADPAPLTWVLMPADSGAGPPLLRGWALGTTPARDLGRKIGVRVKKRGERERQKAGFRQPPGIPPSGPPRVGWPGLATPGGGTGPSARSSLVTVQWIAPAPHGRWSGRRRLPRPTAICGTHPGAVQPSRRASRFPPAPVI